MFVQIKQTLARVQDNLLQDLIGGAALVLMLMVALHLPGFQ